MTQSGALAVSGTTGITAGTGNIDLSNAANTLAQAVSASGASISIADSGPLTLGTVAASGNLTLASTGALDLGTSTVGGNLTANSGNGNVTQSGALAVNGTTGITAGTGNIDLGNAANALAQAVSGVGRLYQHRRCRAIDSRQGDRKRQPHLGIDRRARPWYLDSWR